MKSSQVTRFSALVLLFIVSLMASLWFGGSESIFNSEGTSDFIFYEIRIPKTLTAILAGCSLSVSGLILQVVFRNPLAGPYVLGISSGAALFVATGMLIGQNLFIFETSLAGKSLVLASSILGSLAVTLLILLIAGKVKSNVVLLLIGLMFSQIFSALQTALEYFAEPANLKTFVIWGMGSLSNTSGNDLFYFAPVVIVSLMSLLFFIKPLNAFLLGEEYTVNSGINFTRSRFYLILISSVLTGVTTAFCGPIAFAGIAVPIVSRMIFVNSNQLVHFFSCLLLGGTLLLLADALSNNLLKVALPINMITTFIGAPIVIYLMFRNKQW